MAHDPLARYKVLLETARCFGRALDLQTLIDEILNRSQEVMRAEACTLFLPDLETDELILHSTDPKLAALPFPFRVPAGKGIAGTVFTSRQKVNIADAQTDPRHFKAVSQQVGFLPHAMLTIPLLEGDRCVGVLQTLNPRDRDHFDNEDEEIFEGFGGLIANALIRLEAARRQIELARSKQELLVAREIQESFLPARSQQFKFGQVQLAYLPAAEVGGDFCSVHALGEERLLLAIGDVTGKGMPAALTMARATAMVKALAPQLGINLGEWVSLLNEQLAQELTGGRFIGMTFLFADARSSTLQICACGQFAPIRRRGQEWTSIRAPNHLPLGILPGLNFEALTVPLRPGDLWLLFSDGITEGRNTAGVDFTLETFLKALPRIGSGPSALQGAIDSWREFTRSAPQHDDASLLLMEWEGLPLSPDIQTLCCPENLALGRNFIEGWAVFAGFDDTTVGQIVSACDEAASNVFRHAYECKPGPLAYHAALENGYLTVQLKDAACTTDASNIRPRDLSDLRPGGLGTFIISSVFDEVKYEPSSDGMLLTLRKKLPGSPP